MKIVVLNGSPRKNGNTARLVKAFAQGAAEAGHSVRTEDIARKKISGCKACDYCQNKGQGACAIKDDMGEVYQAIREADMLVLASPVYHLAMTGQMMCAINRTYALGSMANIKKTALILSSAAPGVYESVIMQYKGIAAWWEAEDAGIFTVPGIEPDYGLDNTPKEKLEEIFQFGKNLK